VKNENKYEVFYIKPKDFIFHEKYNETTKTNDLGIIKLPEKIQFTNRIAPICLPSDISLTYETRRATATGWGFHKGEQQLWAEWTSKLRRVNMTVQKEKPCRDFLDDAGSLLTK